MVGRHGFLKVSKLWHKYPQRELKKVVSYAMIQLKEVLFIKSLL